MALDEDRLAACASAISDGEAVNWAEIESSAHDGDDRALVHQMRVLASIADVHRQSRTDTPHGPSSPAVLHLAEAVSNREFVDWDGALRRAANAQEREAIVHLRQLAATAAPASLPDVPSAPPAGDNRSTLRATSAADARPETWGHLHLRDRLGGGAFGEVYRAWEPRLAREVALKLLASGEQQADATTSVIDEGRLLARVRHPNVVTVFGADRHDGRIGLWMEYIKGKTLEEILKAQGPFGAHEAILIGLDLCRALAAVHAAGVIHRDIKAQNVIREDGGRIVLMDFGAGRDLGPETETERFELAGTPLYMAPELLDGAHPSVGTDLYAVGMLLYHLVTASFPFKAKGLADLRRAHRQGVRRRLRDARPDLPTAFVNVVERATGADAAERFSSAGAMEAALLAALEAPADQAARATSAVRRRRILTAALAIAGLVLALFVGLTLRGSRAGDGSGYRAIGVLPLANVSGTPDQDYIAAGLTDGVVTELAKISAVRVMTYPLGSRLDLSHKRPADLGRELKSPVLLAGSVARIGSRLRVNAQIVEASTGRHLWAEEYVRDVQEMFTLQGEIARAVAAHLGVALSAQEADALKTPRTTNPAAYEAYLRGRQARNTYLDAAVPQAIAQFEEAIRLDPGYALAYVGLAASYTRLANSSQVIPRADSIARARAAAEKAIEYDATVAGGHQVLADIQFYFDWDWAAAEASYRRAIEVNPSDAMAHQAYAFYLIARGEIERSMAEGRRAQELEPVLPNRHTSMSGLLYYARRFDAAIAENERALALAPGFPVAHFGIGRNLAELRRYREAIDHLNRSLTETRQPNRLVELARVLALSGDHESARAVLGELDDRQRAGGLVNADNVAYVHAALGDRDRAFALLDEALADRAPGLLWLKVDPRADALRSDPRFARLVASVSGR